MSLLLAYKSPATPNEIRDQRNLLIPQGRNCRPGLLITYESAGPKRLLTSPSLRQLRWLTGFSWRKCAPSCASTIHPRRSAASAPARLNPLLTIQAANSAYRRASCPRGKGESGSDVHGRSSGAVGVAYADAMASGAPAGAGGKRRQLRYAEFQAARPGGTEIRSDRRERARRRDGSAADDADQRGFFRRLRRAGDLRPEPQGRLRDPPGRQRGQSRGRDAQGLVEPDGLRRRDVALQPQPAHPQDRDRQGLTLHRPEAQPAFGKGNNGRPSGYRRFRQIDGDRDLGPA